MKHLFWMLAAVGICGCADAVSPAAGTIQVTSVAAGRDHSCGLSAEQQLYCWGSNEAGQFGSGVIAPESYRPVRTLLDPLRATALAAGDRRTCILVAPGRPLCAGSDGGRGFEALPGDVTLAQIDADTAVCGLTPEGTAYCWADSAAAPVAVAPERRFLAVGVGTYGCGLGADSLAYCWRPGASDAYRVSTVRFGRISVGTAQVCGVAAADSVGYCVSATGQDADATPAPVTRFGGTIPQLQDIAAGNGRACFITLAGDGYCDGLSISGGMKWRQLSAGAAHVCGITTEGTVYCWGSNATGQLGNGTTTTQSSFTLERPL
ncbi:MAG TPA: hypothetical protein VFS40_09625 [Gemmatimonadales bacterium]|nr:hypothetical protein [Gemmatimonadales bacterium]